MPFYTEQEVTVQKSFLDAFLKGEDVDHWTSLDKPRVNICVRKGNPGVNDAAAEQASFPSTVARQANFHIPRLLLR